MFGCGEFLVAAPLAEGFRAMGKAKGKDYRRVARYPERIASVERRGLPGAVGAGSEGVRFEKSEAKVWRRRFAEETVR